MGLRGLYQVSYYIRFDFFISILSLNSELVMPPFLGLLIKLVYFCLMKISWNWLNELLPLNMTADEAAILLTDIGLEVEGFIPIQMLRVVWKA